MLDLLKVKVAEIIAGMLTPETFRPFIEAAKGFIDGVLDKVEDHIAETDNKVDDAVLPFIQSFRDAFNIPDNDEPAGEPDPGSGD